VDTGVIQGGSEYGRKAIGPGLDAGFRRDQILANLEQNVRQTTALSMDWDGIVFV
jgi:hypothetical protein